MDNTQIQNPKFSHLSSDSLIHHFLNQKLEKASLTTQGSESNISYLESKPKQRYVFPNYCFVFGEHRVGDSVEYEVQLQESFKVFRKPITEKYKFRTQYSKLEKLSQKLGEEGFPEKKWFGNKSKDFIQKRKRELENYLNRVAKSRSPEFLEFVLQIKQANLAAEYGKTFRLPN